MRIEEVKDRSPALLDRLLAVWEGSVRETHRFLTEPEIEEIKQYVPQALADVPCLVAAWDEAGAPVAFLGIDGQKVEMLFVAPATRGQGVGKQLLQYGIERHGVNRLSVNEQNPPGCRVLPAHGVPGDRPQRTGRPGETLSAPAYEAVATRPRGNRIRKIDKYAPSIWPPASGCWNF